MAYFFKSAYFLAQRTPDFGPLWFFCDEFTQIFGVLLTGLDNASKITNIRYDQDLIWKTFEYLSLQHTARAFKLLVFHAEDFRCDWISMYILYRDFSLWEKVFFSDDQQPKRIMTDLWKKNHQRQARYVTTRSVKIWIICKSQMIIQNLLYQKRSKHHSWKHSEKFQTSDITYGWLITRKHDLSYFFIWETHWSLWSQF